MTRFLDLFISLKNYDSLADFEEKRARFRKDSDFGFSIVGARPIAVSKVRLGKSPSFVTG